VLLITYPPLSSAEASPLCVVGEAGEKEKESYFFDYFILMGIPSGSLCGGESLST